MSLFTLTKIQIDPRNLSIDSLFCSQRYIEGIKGRLTERLVLEWFDKQEDIILNKDFPITNGEFALIQMPYGIEVISSKHHLLHEYDGIIWESSTQTNYIIEVKSNHLNGYTKKIERAFGYLKKLYGGEIKMLIVLPFSIHTPSWVRKIEKSYPKVHCVNLRISNKRLTALAKQIYNEGLFHTNYR